MLHLRNYYIKIPNNISLTLDNNILIIEGPLGLKKLLVYNRIFLNKTKTKVTVTNSLVKTLPETQTKKTIQGITFSLINYLIYGVQFGFKKQLIIVGVGYKVALENNNEILSFKLGYSHLIKIKIPLNLKVTCNKSTIISISGICKQDVTDFAALIKSQKFPEPYKGKGIKYFDEIIIKKECKRS